MIGQIIDQRFGVKLSKASVCRLMGQRGFIKRLIHGSQRMISLIVDGHPVHNARRVAQFIATIDDRFRLFFLPPHSPELNPDERVWNDLKNNALGRKVITDPQQLHGAVLGHLRFIKKSPDRVRAYFTTKRQTM